MAVNAAPVTSGEQQTQGQAQVGSGPAFGGPGPLTGANLTKLFAAHPDPKDLAKVIIAEGRQQDPVLWSAIHQQLGNAVAQQVIMAINQQAPLDPVKLANAAQTTAPAASASASATATPAPANTNAPDSTAGVTAGDVTTSPINHTYFGVRVIAPAGVKVAALDRCESFIAEELGKNEYAQAHMAKAKVAVVIIPAAVKMTDMTQFKALKGEKTFDGRSWDDVRGSGGMTTPDGLYAIGVGEEDLIDVKTIIGLKYTSGYSVGGHELAHSIEAEGLTEAQHQRVIALYNAHNAKDAGNKGDTWTDTYASSNEKEYFAQATVAFFGHNDLGTAHNGREWLQKHDPEMYALLVEIYDTKYDERGAVVP